MICPGSVTGVWSTSGENHKTQSQTAGGRHLGKKNSLKGLEWGSVKREERSWKVPIWWIIVFFNFKDAYYVVGSMEPIYLLHGLKCALSLHWCTMCQNLLIDCEPQTTSKPVPCLQFKCIHRIDVVLQVNYTINTSNVLTTIVHRPIKKKNILQYRKTV